MVLSIDATQDARSQESVIRPIVLVTINITQPSSKTYRFSHNFRTFSGNEYLDYLIQIPSIVESMNHLDSSPRPGSLFVTINNGPFDSGTMLDEFLSVTYENAEIRVEELLLAEDEARHKPTSSGPVTRFLGRIRKLSFADQASFILECTDTRISVEDAIDWYTIKETDNTPESAIGRRIPKIYGTGIQLKPIEWRGSGFTTLAEDISASKTGTVSLTNIASFATSGSRKLKIGQEIINATNPNTSNNTFNFQTRGDDSSTAILHKRGETVLEVSGSASEYICMDGPDNQGIDKVFYIAGNGERVDVTDQASSFDLADTAKISGRTVASFVLNKSKLKGLKEVDEVLQQPEAPASLEAVNVAETVTLHLKVDSGAERVSTIIDLFSATPAVSSTGSGSFNLFRRYWVLGKDAVRIVNRFRLGVIVQQADYSSGTGRVDKITSRMNGPGGIATVILTFTGDDIKSGQSPFVNCPAGTVKDDFVNAIESGIGSFFSVQYDSDDDSEFNLDTVSFKHQEIVIEFEMSGALGIETATFGGTFGIDLIAECSGRKVPSGDSTYQVAAGTLIDKDADVIRHVLQEQASVASGDLASDWNSQGGTEGSNVTHATILNELGTKTTDLLDGIGSESRANIVNTAGKWKFLRRLTAVSDTGQSIIFSNENILPPGFRVDLRPIEEIWNKLDGFYNLDRPSNAIDPEEAFASSVAAEDASSISKHGDRQLDPYEFRTISETATAQATLDELLREQQDRRFILRFTTPYYDAFLLELGDIVRAQLPFLATTINIRILELRRNLEQQTTQITTIQVSGVLSKTITARYGVIGPLSVTASTLYGVIGLRTVTSTTLYGVARPTAASWDAASPDWDDAVTWD